MPPFAGRLFASERNFGLVRLLFIARCFICLLRPTQSKHCPKPSRKVQYAPYETRDEPTTLASTARRVVKGSFPSPPCFRLLQLKLSTSQSSVPHKPKNRRASAVLSIRTETFKDSDFESENKDVDDEHPHSRHWQSREGGQRVLSMSDCLNKKAQQGGISGDIKAEYLNTL